MVEKLLNLFYEEPDPDRWFPLDRYPRRFVRRLVRGNPRVGGQHRVLLNLCAGLEKIGVRFRLNDYRHIRRHEDELACIVGKPCVLHKRRWLNPILFGAAVPSHPLNEPDLLTRVPVKKVLVPGEWMRRMCEPYWGAAVEAWPVGIDADLWQPTSRQEWEFDFLLYDKIRWEHDDYERLLLQPIRQELGQRGLRCAEIRYGYYGEDDFRALLRRCRAMVFLCEHETQGIAYQQALSSGVPILAWDRGGFWQDPEFFPDRVQYGPVSSVPYWEVRCGVKFDSMDEFVPRLDEFLEKLSAGKFAPREYITENLTLEKCATRYVKIYESITLQ